jgi:hypothetical protein
MKPSPVRDPACRSWATVDLLAMAAWDPDGPCPVGTVDVTHKALARRWRRSVITVRRWLSELVADGVIEVQSGTGRRKSRITFLDFDPPKASAHPQALAVQRESPRPRHPQGGTHPKVSEHPQALVPIGLPWDRWRTTETTEHPQTLTGVGESADADHRFLSTAAIEGVSGSTESAHARDQPCGCGNVMPNPGETLCSTCRINREAQDWKPLDDVDIEYLRAEREGIQMEPTVE